MTTCLLSTESATIADNRSLWAFSLQDFVGFPFWGILKPFDLMAVDALVRTYDTELVCRLAKLQHI